MLTDPATLLGLGDGGARVTQIVDASIRATCRRIGRATANAAPVCRSNFVMRLTSETADFFGFSDRGRLQPGKRADINVIDHQRLQLHTPEVVSDLSAGGRRLVQRADGYAATLVAGTPSSRGASTPVRCPVGSSAAVKSRLHPITSTLGGLAGLGGVNVSTPLW
jgi:N-acyl-D-amino-acid deacylase